MIIICDASPLIFLGALGKLELLPQLYEQVVTTPTVFKEITDVGEDRQSALDVKNLSWLRVLEPQNKVLQTALGGELDQGESSAIALSFDFEASLLLIDERRGRSVARRLGKDVIGTLGLLILAKNKGLLPQIKSSILHLINVYGFRISPSLLEKVLKQVGE